MSFSQSSWNIITICTQLVNILRLLYLPACLFVFCTSTLIIIMCNNSVTYIVAICDFTLVNLTAALTTDVATTSSLAHVNSLAHLQFETPRSRGNVDPRLTENRNTRSQQLLVMPTVQLTTENGSQENTWMDKNLWRHSWFFGHEKTNKKKQISLPASGREV